MRKKEWMDKEGFIGFVIFIFIFSMIIFGFTQFNSMTGLLIGDNNDSVINDSNIGESLVNESEVMEVEEEEIIEEINESEIIEVEEEEVMDEDYDVELIYDISNNSEIDNVEQYCDSLGLKCKALGLFSRQDCGNNGWCGFDDIENATLGFYYCNASLEFEGGEGVAKLAICKSNEIQESGKNSVSAYSVSSLEGLEGIDTAKDFCDSLGLKCKAVEWFYRQDCGNNGWCGFDDLTGSSVKLTGCGVMNNLDRKGSARVILCSGKKEKPIKRSCEDEDGMNYSMKGESFKNEYHEIDSCEGDILNEYFCKKNSLMKAQINCTYGCQEGACLPYVPSVCSDLDGDGFSIEGGDCGAIDCNDSNVSINPNMTEVCGSLAGYDRIDNDCDGQVDLDCEKHCDLDEDGYSPSIKFYCAFIGKTLGECDDSRIDINPGMIDDSCDEIDNNCDGIIDNECVSPEELGEAISEPELVELEDSETSIIGNSNNYNEGGSGGGSSSTSVDLPTLEISEELVQSEDLLIKEVNEGQRDTMKAAWFQGVLAIIFLLIITVVYSKLTSELKKV